MAASTGPDNNSFQIPEVQLGDTFNLWRDATNTSIYKLNKLRVYSGTSSASIDLVTTAGGTLTANLADNVNKGVTFIQPVSFESGVTFNGEVTFNAPRFTVNAQIVTIDDYNLVLGDTGSPSDTSIDAAGGGGLFLRRGTSGNTAEWVWRPVNVQGVTGVWRANTHIGFSGATSGLYPNNGGVLPVHGTGIRLDGGLTSEHGLAIDLSTTGVNGTTSERMVQFSRYSPAGSTAFIDVFAGPSYGSRPFVNVRDGANRKTVTQSNHTFAVGTPLRYQVGGTPWIGAQADNAGNAEVIGVVSRVISGDEFEITYIGDVVDISPSVVADGDSLVPGSVYYLNPNIAGKVVSTAPTAAGTVHKAVFLATSATTATVIPWTGGVISSPVQLSYATSVSTRISQLNAFRPGDVVRFKAGPLTSLTYNYSPPATGSTAAQYPHGIYVKAQANTAEDSEVAGFVTSVSQIVTSGGVPTGVNSSFDILMDGYFDISGISATTNGNDGTLHPGNVYFLNSDCVGANPSLESSTPSLNNQSPTEALRVRKPMLFAVSPQSGYLFSYRGDVQGLSGLCASVALENLLIRNLNSGITGPLVFGLYNGTVGGTPVMHFPDGGATGNVVIGPYSGPSGYTQGATLEVYGGIRAGTTNATSGSIIIASRYNSDGSAFPVTLNVFGSQHLTGNSVIGYGVRPDTASTGFLSTTTANIPRGAILIGGSGSTATVSFLGATMQTTAVGGAVPLTEFFTANTSGATFAGTSDHSGVARFASGVTFAGTSDHSGVARFAVGVTFAGTSDHTGEARFSGGVTAARIYGSGGSTFAGTLHVAGGVTFAGTSDHTGVARFAAGVTMNSSLSVSNNLNVDSGTLFVDAANDRVGIGTSSPGTSLDVSGVARFAVGVTFAGTSDHTGEARFSGGVTAARIYGSGGSTFAGTLHVVGGVTFAGTSDHTGVARFSGGVTASQIYGSGGSTFAGILHVVGGVTFAGTSDHTGVARFAAGVTFIDTVTIHNSAPSSGSPRLRVQGNVGALPTNSTSTVFISATGPASGLADTHNALELRNGNQTSGSEVAARLTVYNGTSGLSIIQASALNGQGNALPNPGGWSVGGYDAIIRTGQSNSKLHFAGGSNKPPHVTIDKDGQVGIGTSSPGSSLDVRGNVNIGIGLPNAILGVSGSISLHRQSGVLFHDSDNSNYVGFKAPAVINDNRIWTLPAADGTNGQVLSTNGSLTLSWKNADGVTGTNKQIQYNEGGTLGATASFVFEYTQSPGFSAGTVGVSGGMYSLGNVGVGITPGAISSRIYSNSTAKLEVRGDIRIPSNGFFVNKGMTLPNAVETIISADENAFIAGTLTVPSGATLTINTNGRLIVM